MILIQFLLINKINKNKIIQNNSKYHIKIWYFETDPYIRSIVTIAEPDNYKLIIMEYLNI
jgi:hypothetical protein